MKPPRGSLPGRSLNETARDLITGDYFIKVTFVTVNAGRI